MKITFPILTKRYGALGRGRMTSNKITESAIEELAIELLEKQGYLYIYAPEIAPDGENPEIKQQAEMQTIEHP